MKKLLCLLIFGLVISSYAMAQVPTFRFGLRAGYDMSKAFVTNSGSSKLQPGYNIGATVEYGPYSTIYFRSGLYFTSHRSQINDLYINEKGGNVTKENNKATFNQMSLKLPIMVVIKQDLSLGSNLSYGVGPFISYGLGGKTKLETYGDTPTSEKWNTFNKDNTYSLKRFNFGGTINIDYQFDYNYIVGIGADFGFLNLINEGASADRNFQVFSFNISLGYLF